MKIYQENGPHTSELIIAMEDFSGHGGRNIDGSQEVHGGFSIGEKNQEERMLIEFRDAKHLCIVNTCIGMADKKITNGS